MEGKIIKSGCDFTGLKINKLRCKCKECEKIWLKSSLSSLPNGLSEIYKKECKACMEEKNMKKDALNQ